MFLIDSSSIDWLFCLICLHSYILLICVIIIADLLTTDICKNVKSGLILYILFEKFHLLGL